MLVENSSQASHLNLRLPHGSKHQIEAMDQWARRQLDSNGSLNWNALPRELQACGKALRDAIHSHQSLQTSQETKALFHGVSRLIAEPEFSQSAKVRPLLELMDQSPAALTLSAPGPGYGVWIGQEHPEQALHHCSVVQATYTSATDGVGHVALVGPMRMAYATALAAVRSAAHHLDYLLN
jgi:heat-inducible transcriptional repressor